MIRVLIYEKNEEEVRQDNRDQFELILSRNVSITGQRDGREGTGNCSHYCHPTPCRAVPIAHLPD